ncbi:MAG: DNA repair protein RecO [Candidatus Delongbacteria bacterium]
MKNSTTVQTKGIVLKNSRIRDNSADIAVITPGMGIIEFSKFGYNSKKNDFRPLLQPINLLDLKFDRQKNRLSITDVSLICNYTSLKSDYGKIQAVMSIFKSILSSNTFDDKDYDLIYLLIKRMCSSFEENDMCLVTASVYFYFQLAWCMGISFSFKDDPDNGHNYLQTENGLFFKKGTLLEKDTAYRLSDHLYEQMKKFQDLKFAQIHKLDYITLKEFNEFREMFRRYTGYHLNRPFYISALEISEE